MYALLPVSLQWSRTAFIITKGASVDVPGNTEKFCPRNMLGCTKNTACIRVAQTVSRPLAATSVSTMGLTLDRSPPQSAVLGMGHIVDLAQMFGESPMSMHT